MFRFIELQINNWSVWQAIKVPLGRDVIIITGPNGSGKTTLLDAVRQLLHAPRLSSKRRLQHYIEKPDSPALIRAVVSNSGTPGSGPPFRQERITSSEVTLACLLTPSPSGTPEKRYAILAGRPSLEEITNHLENTRDWYTPERYARALEHAGVSRSLMAVLAIEQGNINQLFDWKPRDLFLKVTEMLGNQTVLERYRSAKRRYNESERDLDRQNSELLLRRNDLAKVLHEVNLLDIWEQKRAKVEWLEKTLPAAQLQVQYRLRKEINRSIQELTTKVRKGDTEIIRLERDLKILSDKEEQAKISLKLLTKNEDAAREQWGDFRAKEAIASNELKELEIKERKFKSLPVRDLGKLIKDERIIRQKIADEEIHYKEATAIQSKLNVKVNRLRSGIPAYPDTVDATIADLVSSGIQYTILASTVCKVSKEHCDAAEAALGNARFGIIVQNADEKQTILIAKKHNFPGPIYAGKTLTFSEKAGVFEFTAGAPEWIRQFAMKIHLEKDGTWSDERGSWVATSDGAFLGKESLKRELEKLETELKLSDVNVNAIKASYNLAEKQLEQMIKDKEQEQERHRLQAEIINLPDMHQRVTKAIIALKKADTDFNIAKTEREKAQLTFTNILQDRNSAENQFKQFIDKFNGEKVSLSENKNKIVQCESEIVKIEPLVNLENKQKAECGELSAVETVKYDLEYAQAEFERLGAPPAPEIREEAKQLEMNINQIEEHVNTRKQEADVARQELDECRKQYLAVVSAALSDYRKRVQALAKVANVMVEADISNLENNDQVLDEAGIEARFGFDGKPPLPLGDPSFSGGQQVIAGLILLLAMAETEGHGFFILDEPFAHLSLDRVDQVGNFLRGTNSQFIITAPTTLDRAQLDPASMVIILSKKRKGEPFAPPPMIAEA